MATTWSRVTRVVILLLATQLSACYDPDNKPATTALNSFPKGIAFDNEDNLYISTVTGSVFRYDGYQLNKLLARGDHGLDLAAHIRYSQDNLFIHNKRYAGKEAGYIDEVLLFSTRGEFVDRLITEKSIQATNFSAISVNRHAQLYSITDDKTAQLIRINPDKLNLTKIDLSVYTLTAGIVSQDDSLLANNPAATVPDQTDINSALNNIVLANLISEEEAAQLSESIDKVSAEQKSLLTSMLTSPTSITTDGMNNIYIGFIHSILKFDANGNYQNSITLADINNSLFTGKMAVDPHGNLVITRRQYVNNNSRISLVKFDPDGNFLSEFIPAEAIDQGASIQDIAFDNAGNFYMADTLKGIYKFDSYGQFVDIIVKPF